MSGLPDTVPAEDDYSKMKSAFLERMTDQDKQIEGLKKTKEELLLAIEDRKLKIVAEKSHYDYIQNLVSKLKTYFGPYQEMTDVATEKLKLFQKELDLYNSSYQAIKNGSTKKVSDVLIIKDGIKRICKNLNQCDNVIKETTEIKIANASKELEELNKEKSAAFFRLRDIEDANSLVTEEIKSRKASIEDLQQKVTKKMYNFKLKEKELQEIWDEDDVRTSQYVESVKTSWQKEIVDKKQNIEDAVVSIDSYKKNKASIEEQLTEETDVVSRIEKIKQSLTNELEKNSELLRKKRNYDRVLDEIKSKVEVAYSSKQVEERKFNDLSNDLMTLMDSEKNLNEKIIVLEEQRTTTNQEFNNLKEEVKLKKWDFEKNSKEIENMQKKELELTESLEKWKSTIAEKELSHENSIKELNSKLAEVEANILNKTDMLMSLDKDLVEERKELEETEKLMEANECFINDKKKTVVDGDMEQAKKLTAIKEEIKDLRQIIIDDDLIEKDLQRQVEEKEQVVVEKAKFQKILDDTVKQTKLAEANEEITKLDSVKLQFEKVKAELNDAKIVAAETQEKIESLSSVKSELSCSTAQLSLIAEETTVEVVRCNAEEDNLRKEIDNMKLKLEELKQTREKIFKETEEDVVDPVSLYNEKESSQVRSKSDSENNPKNSQIPIRTADTSNKTRLTVTARTTLKKKKDSKESSSTSIPVPKVVDYSKVNTTNSEEQEDNSSQKNRFFKSRNIQTLSEFRHKMSAQKSGKPKDVYNYDSDECIEIIHEKQTNVPSSLLLPLGKGQKTKLPHGKK